MKSERALCLSGPPDAYFVPFSGGGGSSASFCPVRRFGNESSTTMKSDSVRLGGGDDFALQDRVSEFHWHDAHAVQSAWLVHALQSVPLHSGGFVLHVLIA